MELSKDIIRDDIRYLLGKFGKDSVSSLTHDDRFITRLEKAIIDTGEVNDDLNFNLETTIRALCNLLQKEA